MRYRVVIVYDKETGRISNYCSQYRRWWSPFWKPVVSEDPRGISGTYDAALRSISRMMAARGGVVSVKQIFV